MYILQVENIFKHNESIIYIFNLNYVHFYFSFYLPNFNLFLKCSKRAGLISALYLLESFLKCLSELLCWDVFQLEQD